MAEYSTQHVESQAELKKIIDSKEPLLVDFWAEWCGPCRTMGPYVDQLAKDYQGKIHVVKVDVEKAPDLAAEYKVTSIPMIIMFREGKLVHTTVGAMPAHQLRQEVDKYLIN